MYLGIVYEININEKSQSLYGLVGYNNSNYADNLKEHKSVMGHYSFINNGVMSWCSKKQRTVFTSTTEIEYIALRHTTQENILIRQFFNKLSLAESIYTCIFHGDNKTSIILIKNAKN